MLHISTGRGLSRFSAVMQTVAKWAPSGETFRLDQETGWPIFASLRTILPVDASMKAITLSAPAAILLAVGGEVNRQWLQEEIAIFRNKLPGVRVTNANDRARVGRADGCTVARKSQRNRATGNRSGFPECRRLVARTQLEVARGTQESIRLQANKLAR
jgi:hypothetical protein